MNHKEAWEDLQSRLESAETALLGMKQEAFAASEKHAGDWYRYFTDEVHRFRSKIEGVNLALSYMKEYGELNDH